MSDEQISWGEAEWSRIRQVVHDEALRSRVAASFLPLYGPLPGAAEAVPVNALSVGPNGLEVDDYTTQRFVSVSVNVQLKNHMLADPELAVATDLFRRAANIVARVEDLVIFQGVKGGKIQSHDKRSKVGKRPGAATDQFDTLYRLGGGSDYPGLTDAHLFGEPVNVDMSKEVQGPEIFDAIVKAVLAAEDNGYHRPFAVVLGPQLFADLHRPIPNSMVLPRDAVPPLIEGPLLRSSELPDDTGVLVSLQGNPVEIVVPADISVRYLQATLEGAHVFRVSQRFLLRIKDPGAIVRIVRHK